MTFELRLRRSLALLGPLFWIAAGFMPIFGGAAKHNYQCRGREFTGEFDDCFNDYIPVAEMAALFIAVATTYWFFKFSRALFDSGSSALAPKRYSFDNKLSGILILALAGIAWSLWRASTYQLVPALAPFIAFWLLFAGWFAAGVATGWTDRNRT